MKRTLLNFKFNFKYPNGKRQEQRNDLVRQERCLTERTLRKREETELRKEVKTRNEEALVLSWGAVWGGGTNGWLGVI